MSRGTGKHLFVLSLLIATILLTVTIAGTAEASNPRNYVGAVYTMTNAASGNAVIMFHRTARGLLVPVGAFSTEGLGSGDGLGNQGALALSEGNRWLFVVNPEATTSRSSVWGRAA
jgi:6-phosphogluconolactonase